jgi:predicted nuclease with TOPRIM domain
MVEITLEFIAKQLERVISEQGALRDEMLVMGARIGYVEASLERIEASITTLSLEMRAVRNRTDRLERRVDKLEEA